MLKRFFNWLEGDISRGRKVVLMGTVFSFLLITFVIFLYGMIDPTRLSDKLTTLYTIFTGLMAAIYGFYTGTSSDKSNALANKAADIMMQKLQKVGEN